jgi:hypothetical protein
MREQHPSENARSLEDDGQPSDSVEERHFTIAEVAAMWNLSDEFVRQLVRDEPGVTEWVRQKPGRRRYRVLRIPRSVVARLYKKAQERGQRVQNLSFAVPAGGPSFAPTTRLS